MKCTVMLFSWPFVAHFHLTISSPPPLFCVVQVFCGFPFCDLLLCIAFVFSYCLHLQLLCSSIAQITYFSMFFYCASPWSWIFVLIWSIVVSFCCASLWWLCFPLVLFCFRKCVDVFFFWSIVTHCFCLHLLLRISTHPTTIVLLCFSTMYVENFHVIHFCCASPWFGLLWCLFTRFFQIVWWMAWSQNDGYHVGSIFWSFVCCGKLGETWGSNLVDIWLWCQGCHSFWWCDTISWTLLPMHIML